MTEILTPITLWKNFDDTLPTQSSIIKNIKINNINYSEIYFSGRETGEGRPRIYGLLARQDNLENLPYVLILPDYKNSVDFELATLYVNKGYNVLMIDYCGESVERKSFTMYPKNIEYANYYKAENHIKYVETSANKTSWYEWVSVSRYAVSYLKNEIKADKIGVIGIRHGSQIMWQLIATDVRINCAISLFGFGWESYRGKFKFDENTELKMNEERHRYIAGIDAHAYAPYSNAPVLILTSTNDSHFDVDRAYDTLARINEKVESLCNYSLLYDGFLGKNSLYDIDLFLEKYLKSQNLIFPKNIDLNIEFDKDNYLIKVKFDKLSEISDYKVYYAEDSTNSSFRDWVLTEEIDSTNKDKKTFKPELYKETKLLFAFAKAKYNNGLTISSKIICQKLEQKALNMFPKSRVIYTSKKLKDCFTVYNAKKSLICDIFFQENNESMSIVNGPFGIKGAYSKYGLMTYRVGTKRYKAEDNFILKLDAYSKLYSKLKLSVATNYRTKEEKIYLTEVGLCGGDIWQNIQLNALDFKTSTGQSLKDFKDINVLMIESESEFAVNNILWI